MRKRNATTLSLFQLAELFPTADSAVRYFERIRWGDTPTCTKCGQPDKLTSQKKVGTYWCGLCRAYCTVFTDTPLERNKIDARKWLFAAYLLLTARKGISSMQLSKELSIQQRTAWYMMHRLRLACDVTPELLSGIVEIDETYIGGKEKNKKAHKKLKKGRGTVGKTPVMGLRQRGGKTIAKPVTGTDQQTLHREIRRHVDPSSVVWTDDHKSYQGVKWLVSYHDTVNHSAKEWVRGFVHTNGLESVWAVLKRGLHGTFHRVSVKHLGHYVNEFAFRLNEGNCAIDTTDRLASLFRAMPGKTITFKALVA